MYVKLEETESIMREAGFSRTKAPKRDKPRAFSLCLGIIILFLFRSEKPVVQVTRQDDQMITMTGSDVLSASLPLLQYVLCGIDHSYQVTEGRLSR